MYHIFLRLFANDSSVYFELLKNDFMVFFFSHLQAQQGVITIRGINSRKGGPRALHLGIHAEGKLSQALQLQHVHLGAKGEGTKGNQINDKNLIYFNKFPDRYSR